MPFRSMSRSAGAGTEFPGDPSNNPAEEGMSWASEHVALLAVLRGPESTEQVLDTSLPVEHS